MSTACVFVLSCIATCANATPPYACRKRVPRLRQQCCTSGSWRQARELPKRRPALLHAAVFSDIAAGVSNVCKRTSMCMYIPIMHTHPRCNTSRCHFFSSILIAQVAAAVSAHLAVLNTNARYLSHDLGAYCARLTATMPRPLEVRRRLPGGASW